MNETHQIYLLIEYMRVVMTTHNRRQVSGEADSILDLSHRIQHVGFTG